MKPISRMTPEELGGLICQTLQGAGVTVTLTGGACVAIWSKGQYVSDDLDFVEEGPVPRRKIREVMKRLGFHEKGRHFVHPETNLFVEFPTGPLMAGDQRVEHVVERSTSAGTLRLLSPTDCVKDRLAAFFHWNDQQSLVQAVLVARSNKINFSDIKRWSRSEKNMEKFQLFAARLKRRSDGAKRHRQ